MGWVLNDERVIRHYQKWFPELLLEKLVKVENAAEICEHQ
jgi:hypothetical protein